MNEEVKELLSRLKRFNEEQYLIEIDCGCSKLLLDYITNLQEENERLKKEKKKLSNDLAEAILFNQKRCEQNKELQQRIERLKEENRHIFANVNDDVLLRSNAMNYAEAQECKKRIDKAIEFIKECQLGVDSMDRPVMLLDQIEGKDLLKILGGDDNDI